MCIRVHTDGFVYELDALAERLDEHPLPDALWDAAVTVARVLEDVACFEQPKPSRLTPRIIVERLECCDYVIEAYADCRSGRCEICAARARPVGAPFAVEFRRGSVAIYAVGSDGGETHIATLRL